MDNEMLCQFCFKDGRIVTHEIKKCIYLNIPKLNDEGVDRVWVSKSNPNIMPKKIIFNGPATIVMWADGTKTVVKQSNLDDYDYEKGFAMCVVKKVFGDQYAYIRKMVDKSYEDILLTSNINNDIKHILTKLFGKDKQ